MNSLEFIDEEIKRYKAIVSITSGEKKTYYKKVIKQLQQIKTELEAWYEIKDLYKKGYFSRIALPTECHEKFKKALEVKDE